LQTGLTVRLNQRSGITDGCSFLAAV